jgi:hypothetical protein
VWGCKPHAQPPTWRTRVYLFVWLLPFNLSGMGDSTSSYATAGIALRFSGALKPHHHDKVGTPLVGGCEQLIKHKFPQCAPANLETSCMLKSVTFLWSCGCVAVASLACPLPNRTFYLLVTKISDGLTRSYRWPHAAAVATLKNLCPSQWTVPEICPIFIQRTKLWVIRLTHRPPSLIN